MNYVVIRNFGGVFEVDKEFNRFTEAVEYLEAVGAWGRWIVPCSTARMIAGCGVSDPDTPNFRHFAKNGDLVWYIEPEHRAKILFEELTGIPFALEAGEGLLPRLKGTPLQASLEEYGEDVVIDVYRIKDEDVVAHLHLTIYPECVAAHWADGSGAVSSPPSPMPSPEFFRALLGLA